MRATRVGGGRLFNLTVPSHIDFDKVWTEQDINAVDWDIVFSVGTACAIFQAFAIGFLTTVKNIMGVSENVRPATIWIAVAVDGQLLHRNRI